MRSSFRNISTIESTAVRPLSDIPLDVIQTLNLQATIFVANVGGQTFEPWARTETVHHRRRIYH